MEDIRQAAMAQARRERIRTRNMARWVQTRARPEEHQLYIARWMRLGQVLAYLQGI